MDAAANNYNPDATVEPENTCQYDVTLTVDASQTTFATMCLAGTFQGWNPGANPMTDNGDGTYTITVSMAAGAQEYKFIGDCAWGGDEQFDGSESCTTAPAEFVNRVVDVSGPTVVDMVCYNTCEACVDAPATLVASVDLCGESASEVRLTGPFWGWDPLAGPTATDNGDGTWSVTFDPAPDADMEYLWIVDGVQENLIGAGDCTPITDGASYANRLWTVGSADISDVYASCEACGTTGGGSTIFNVDMSCVDGAGATVNGATTFTEVFVTGPWCGWCAADGYNVLTDADGDGIYSVEIADLTGTVEYKYGIDGFTDQEQLVDDMANGADCAPVTDFAGYANRQVTAGSTTNDTFGSCASCADQVEPANVTFKIDMNQYAEAYVSSGGFLNGSFNGWCGTCNPMDDADGEGVWELTLSLNPGTIEYKFTLDGWNYQEELAGIAGIEACTSTIDGFTNRSLTFDADIVLDAVCWESCDACPAASGCTDPAFLSTILMPS